MKILAASDIHNNIAAVEQLRSMESNSFDLVLIPGDIGDDKVEDIMEIFKSFQCPVFYIYGNWDNELAYDKDFGPDCHHLHAKSIRFGDFAFAGFSGVAESWGKNPIFQSLRAEIRGRHARILAKHEKVYESISPDLNNIRADFFASIKALPERKQDWSVNANRPHLERLEEIRDTELERAMAPLRKVEGTTEFMAYRADSSTIKRQTLAKNRQAICSAIQESGTPADRTVVITHDRLSKTTEDLAGVPFFLFGHHHGYYDRTYAGSRFVNVSALDMWDTYESASGTPAGYFNINNGNYTIIEIRDAENILTRRVGFDPDLSKWKTSVVKIVGSPSPTCD